MRRSALLALAITVAPLALVAQRGAGSGRAPVGTITHTWKPVRAGGQDVVGIDVRAVLAELPASAGATFSLRAPIVYAGVPGIAERTQGLTVRDAEGEVPLRIEDDVPTPGGFPYFRHWRATRSVSFPLTVSYRALTPTTPPRGPPFGLYSAFGGVSGAGSGFLVVPEGNLYVTNTVQWDLTDLAVSSSAVTSFGEGKFRVIGPPGSLMQGWIMAGPLGRHLSEASASANEGFSGAWLGTPAWDAATELAWAERMFEWLGKSYGYLSPLPRYRVFIRTGTGRGGTALGNSFMVNAPPRTGGEVPSGQSVRVTLTHEMGHLFVGGIEAPDGVSSWFSEGLNVYYTRLLPMRGGFTSVAKYGREINAGFRDYYFNVARNLSADSITKIGFGDENVRHIPYARGSLYFADLDSKIRAHSRGNRNLDKVMREIFERRQRGAPFNHGVWIETVTREAGALAAEEFDHLIIRGTATLVPASDAFGPCFQRRPTAPTADRPAGYEWIRVEGISEEACRKPW